VEILTLNGGLGSVHFINPIGVVGVLRHELVQSVGRN
jgi:hypothetical protein